MDINGDCLFCASHLEDIDNLFKKRSFVNEIYIADFCPMHINGNMHFLDRIDLL